MGYDKNFIRLYRIIFPVVVHKRERIQGEFRLNKTNRGFDVLKEGIFDDRNRKTKNRNG